jgi:cell division protein FtsI/penicillin-binding protein 2
MADAAPEARAVVLDVQSGRILATRHLPQLARTLAAPGSTLKPILLFQSLQANQWNSEHRVLCRKNLTIHDHSLACSHPLAPPFAAREALAWSCNTYFAELARAIPPNHLLDMLRPTGILEPTRLVSEEAISEFHSPQTTEEMQLAVLGVEGLKITPLELAVAYRWLAMRMIANPTSTATTTVLGGLSDSASFGMASPAGSGGVSIAGKTGTAEGARFTQTHGWFVGLAPASKPEIVVVVYLPTGRGADAAHLAGILLNHSPMVHK